MLDPELTVNHTGDRKVGGGVMAMGPGPGSRRDVVVPAVWVPFYEETHIPAAVWVGDMLRLTGHTGEDADGRYPDSAEEQARGTFRNIALTLAEAGADWSDVVEINSYRVNLRSQEDTVLVVAAEFLDAPYPAWTDVGVTELFPPDALVEISCVAMVAHRQR
jgi:enamine deaminase RidA (YjgF/YER057c/UK114 family)